LLPSDVTYDALSSELSRTSSPPGFTLSTLAALVSFCYYLFVFQNELHTTTTMETWGDPWVGASDDRSERVHVARERHVLENWQDDAGWKEWQDGEVGSRSGQIEKEETVNQPAYRFRHGSIRHQTASIRPSPLAHFRMTFRSPTL
jgi:hypothetical protein